MVVKEVCVDNLKDAVRAYEAGANRIEYCSDLDQDGLTPDLDELLTLSKTFSPSSMPGPLNESNEDLFALSKDALKM